MIDWDKPLVTVNSKYPVTILHTFETEAKSPNRLINWTYTAKGEQCWIHAIISHDGRQLIRLDSVGLHKRECDPPFVKNAEEPEYLVLRTTEFITKDRAEELKKQYPHYTIMKIVKDE